MKEEERRGRRRTGENNPLPVWDLTCIHVGKEGLCLSLIIHLLGYEGEIYANRGIIRFL